MSDSQKHYTISFTPHPKYLYVHLEGNTISPDLIRDYIAEIIAKCDEIGVSRILLFRDIPAVLSEGLVFLTVNESLTALRGKKLALVNPHSRIQAEVDFAMTVGQNRGGNYRSFPTTEAAVEWLVGDDRDATK